MDSYFFHRLCAHFVVYDPIFQVFIYLLSICSAAIRRTTLAQNPRRRVALRSYWQESASFFTFDTCRVAGATCDDDFFAAFMVPVTSTNMPL